jgi:hypothetical protein
MANSLTPFNRPLAALFFADFSVEKDDEYTELFRDSSIDTSGAPTPRAKEYMMSGEWMRRIRLVSSLFLMKNFEAGLW